MRPGRARHSWGRSSADALIAVVDAFSGGSDPAADLGSLHLELLVADQDHVERRLERVRKEAKSGDPALRDEVERLEAALDLLAEDRPLRELPGGVRRRWSHSRRSR